MNLKKIVVMTAFLGAVFSLSQTAYAGLFDDLNKMQKDLEKLQGGNMPKAPSAGGNSTGFSGMSNMGSSASGGFGGCGDAANADTIDCVCRATVSEGRIDGTKIFKKLPPSNIQVLKSDFSILPNDLNTRLNQTPILSKENADVVNLGLYRNAFETAEIASLFSQFLDTVGKKADYLSILKQVADAKSGFDTKKKALKRDAQQAYGLTLLYYQSLGANANSGMNYMKTAAKGDPRKSFIATYQLGHRAYFGLGEPRNLSKAANWMLKSYEAVQERKNKDAQANTSVPLTDGFINLVSNEFMSLVSDPSYKRRDQYAELAQAAQQFQAEMAASLKDAKGRSPSIVALTKAFLRRESEINAKIFGAIGQEERATIESQRVQKFIADKSRDAQKYKDYEYSSQETREFLRSSLKNISALDANQKQKFSEAMSELAILAIEMRRIQAGLLGGVLSGNIDIAQMRIAEPILTSIRTTCNTYNDLNDVGTKLGAPKAAVKFDPKNSKSVVEVADD